MPATRFVSTQASLKPIVCDGRRIIPIGTKHVVRPLPDVLNAIRRFSAYFPL